MNSLLQHQKACVTHLERWRVGALFMDAGTGKTRAALELINSTNCDKVVWIAPLRTLSNIRVEIGKWKGINNKDILYYGVESIGQSDRIYLQVYSEVDDRTMLVVDESIKIKNFNAKRTKRLLELSKLTEYKLILNGTPVSRNLLDLWAQMEFLSPKILKMSEEKFKNTFCKYTTITKWIGGYSTKREFITGYGNLDYLYSLIKNYVYKCGLKLSIAQIYNQLTYKLDEFCLGEYKRLKEEYLDDECLEIKNNNIFLEMTQKMQHSYCCTPQKFALVEELFKSSLKQSDTLIFCKFVDSRLACEKRYKEAKVLSYQKEAFGLNLQAYRHIIFFDKTWDYATRLQATRRIFRQGQNSDCTYYDLIGNVGLEDLIDNNISKKISMAEFFKNKSINEIRKIL
ncbi:protein, SNF2 family [Prevotella amnii]|uniref:Protein, SNF2 family n=1 Tax=Prevotella amnii TaxID=419005 RepID=A0A134B375_9BACT|nr:DEAD/DEAH box helicase [Prevotella amnii]KXB74384.1 protein, SNF2 family [Prevotella amnii]